MRLWSLLVALSGAACAPSAPPKVLFIGNSYTYFNNLPAMVSALGRGDGRPVQTTMIVRGGATLDDHWKGDSAAAAIRRGGWTHVVLQEQSQLGNFVIINGAPAISDDGGYLAAARRFDAIIRQSGATTVLFRHWSRRDAAPGDRIRLAAAFDQAQDSLHALGVPAAAAWDSARRRIPDLPLYIQDGSHPTPAGSYLAALVFYSTLTGRSPIGLPRRLTGRATNDEGVPGGDSTAVLADIDSVRAGELQQIAAEVIRRGSQVRPAGPPPPLPSGPAMPAGSAPDPSRLTGSWVGRATVAPFPAVLEISVKPGPPAPLVGATLVFGPNRVGGEPTAASFEGGRLKFTQPNGLQGLPMSFEGVMVGDSLTGVVRIEGAGAAARFHIIGTWAVAKRRP